MESKLKIGSRSDLSEFIGSKSDEELTYDLVDMGVDDVLDKAFRAIAEKFVPERARNRVADVQWLISSPFGTHPYLLRIAGGSCEAIATEIEKPTLTVKMSLSDFMCFLAGRLDAISAFTRGRLRVRGDLTLAAGLERWFDYD